MSFEERLNQVMGGNEKLNGILSLIVFNVVSTIVLLKDSPISIYSLIELTNIDLGARGQAKARDSILLTYRNTKNKEIKRIMEEVLRRILKKTREGNNGKFITFQEEIADLVFAKFLTLCPSEEYLGYDLHAFFQRNSFLREILKKKLFNPKLTKQKRIYEPFYKLYSDWIETGEIDTGTLMEKIKEKGDPETWTIDTWN